MALTPDDIERRQFTTSPNGYNRDEVDAFLVESAASFRYAVQNLLPGVVPFDTERRAAGKSRPVEVAKEVAEILDAAHRAAESMLAEAENDAARVRASAEHHAAQVREDAERERERVKRILLRSEDQAASIVAQAEEQAQQQRALAERDSVRRTRDSLARAKQRTNDLAAAEQQLRERLEALRGDIDAVLQGDPTTDWPRSEQGDQPPADTDREPDEVDVRSPKPDRARPEASETVPADPTARLVQAAVNRAASTATGGSGPATRRSEPRDAATTRTATAF